MTGRPLPHREERQHLAGLNGLRAIAAVSVVIGHTRLRLDEFGRPIALAEFPSYGVSIFFALSGFLITYLLLLEKDEREVDIGKFYVRRILRIWPLYYLYLGLAALTAYVYTPAELPGSLGFYVLLMANLPFINHTTFPRLEHYWSLGVEEQFYLAWPWIVARNRNILRVITAGALVYVGARALFRFVQPHFAWGYDFTQVSRFDCMAIGAIGAILFHQNKTWFVHFCQRTPVQVACWLVLVLVAFDRYYVPLFGHDVIALITVLIIVSQITMKNRVINLDQPLFESIGRISYGIYVFHPLLLFYYARLVSRYVVNGAVREGLAYAGVLGLTIAVAYCSFHFFERPFLRWKEHFAVIKTKA